MKPKHINKKLIRTTTSLFAILMAIFMVAGSGVSSIIPDVANETTITGTQSSVIANALDTEGRMPLLATNAEQQSTPQPIDRDITVFSMDFDGTWVADPDPSDPYMVPATGWDVDGICTAAQSGYPALTHYWSQFDDATYPIPHQGGFAAGLWWSDGSGGDPTSGAQDEWIITPSIDCTGYENLSLSFYSVYTMSSYGAAASAHDYIQVSTDGGTTWTVVADLVHDAAYYFPGATGGPGGAGWNWNEYPPVIDMSAYDGVPSLMIAFNYLSDGAAPRGIWAVDTMELYQVEYAGHDTGVTDIIAPVSGPAAITTPEVTVSNFVPTDEEDAPVNVKISKLQKDFLLTEDFEDAIPSVPIFPPVGWSIIQTDPVSTWYKYSTGYARCQETGATGAQDEWLITQTFDCSALTSIAMEMGYHYMGTPSVDDYVEILGSTDNGATWPYMIDNLTVYSSGLKSWDISTWAAGQSQVKLAWRYVSGPATGSHYFYFRQFKLSQPPMLAPGGVSEDFNGAWGPYGDNPPTGWTIIDLGSQSPPVWDTNDWHKYYYSTFGSDCARVYYTPSPYEQMDEWLITPTVDCSSMTEVSLLFRQYFYFYTTYPGYGEILGSTDNGATWTETVVSYSASQANAIYSYDLSSWAAGQSQVKIAFHYYSTGAQGRYWYVDDVQFGEIADPIILFENYWFDDVTPTYWGTNGWINVDVLNMDSTIPPDPNIWRAADGTYLTTPTGITPYSGSYMAIYDTGLLYPQGSLARLYCPNPIDLSSYTAVNLKFMLHMNNYGSSYTDSIAVQGSLDGITWNDVVTINTYDATNPGWVQQLVDMSAYAGQSTFYLGFLGIDGGYRDIIIDDISLEAPTFLVEYDETVYVDIPGLSSVDVTFPAWTPNDWQAQGNVEVEYFIEACTQVVDDADTSNDCDNAYFTFEYPYLHDVGAISISEPTSGDAQTQPVVATITNFGQFDECCFKTYVEIGRKIYDIDGYFNNFEGTDGGFTVTGGTWAWGAPTSGPMGAYSGDKLWATNLAGNYPTGRFMLDTVPITVPTDGDLSFWHWYDFEASYDGYNVKISTDSGSTWTLLVPVGGYTGTANSANPLYPEACWTGHVQKFWEYETFDLTAYEGMTVMFRFDMGADGSVYYPGTYIDDILVGTVDITIATEYLEFVCIPDGVLIEPGEEMEVEFPDWTPADLALGISGNIEYVVNAYTDLNDPLDENPANDALQVDITLDYFHDVKVKDITEPSDGGKAEAWLQYDNGVYSNAFGSTTGEIYGGGRYTPTELAGYDGWKLNMIKWKHYDATAIAGTVEVYDAGTATAPGAMITSEAFSVTGADWFEVPLSSPVTIDETKDIWIIVHVTHPSGEYPLECSAPGFAGKSGWFSSDGAVWYDLIGYGYDVSFMVRGLVVEGGGPGGADIYLQPGTHPIEAIVMNDGTFPETGMDVIARIYEYTPNATKIYEDIFTGVDLVVDEEATFTFADWTVTRSDIYQLEIEIPLAADDFPANNIKKLGIGIDDTDPVSTHTLDPATPNGANGWYTTPVEVTLEATDDMSGVGAIKYKIDGGAEQTYSGPFTISTSDEHTVVYWAVDNVGNKEVDNTFDVNIDVSAPIIDLTWESAGGLSKDIIFTATCDDADSGMDYVEFYFNGVLQYTDDAPAYEWVMTWTGGIKFTVLTIAFDLAGNTADDRLESKDNFATSQSATVHSIPAKLIK